MRMGSLLAAGLGLFMMASCAHRPPSPPGLELDALRQRHADFQGALRERDLERTMSFFAEDAVAHVANMPPFTGRSAIRQLYSNVFRFLSGTESTTEVLRVSSRADMAYATGSVTNVFAGQGGPAEYAGKYAAVWENRGDGWMITVYSVSNNRPDPSP